MTLLELQDVMAGRILVHCSSDTKSYDKNEIEKSNVIAKMAKQMINNADVVLRSQKLICDYEKTFDELALITGIKNDK